MFWLIGILSFFIILFVWMLLLNIEMEIDTRVPQARISWGKFGNAIIWYDAEWKLKISLLFFRKTIRLADIKSKSGKTKAGNEKKVQKKRLKINPMLKKMYRVIKTFHVTKFEMAVDTGDFTVNARLYPLIFFTPVLKRVLINFGGENYLWLKIKNQPWRILYSFII